NNKKKKKINKKVIIGAIVVIVLALAAFNMFGSKDTPAPITQDQSINVKTTVAGKMDLEVMTPLTGRIEPVEEASIIPMVSGEVIKIHVDLGTKVSIGTPLFELDKEQVQNSYNQALAAYNQAKDAYNNAKSNYERTKTLFSEGAVSKQQYEQAQLQSNSTYQAMTQAQAGLNSAKDALDNTIITSPINGYVTLVNINEGEIASQAMPAVAVANIDTVEIETSISEHLINKVHIGDSVKVYVSSASDEEFGGTVTALSPAPAQGSLTYPLKVSIDNTDTLIKSGMFAEIHITSESKKDVLAVPSDSVIIKGGQTVIAVLNGNQAHFKKVTVGIDNGEYAEILEGLTEGSTIITQGQYYLDEGSQVTVVD
ncbi:MAG: efflux RND transporter periplasmic adaptor subunit, partial [Clostridia bacterium]|nr:efflux RND transporter periplasmic adaptor subunit [Clostridia bacterium]